MAVVGPSGSGKTCLSKLLTGIWRPGRGSVRLDGVEICDWNHDELGALIGYVPQEIEFFEGTIAENIARLGPVNSEMVVEAATLIGAHEMILALPQGYDTVLGESGHALSAGQRQRIAIARAVLKNPPLLLLDEATSALDAESERMVQAALASAMRDRTTLVIAHRLATVQQADRIVVIDQGRLVEQGTHEQLVAVNGLYARLAALQFKS